MGASTSSVIPDEVQLNELQIKTGFSKEHILRLYSRFIALDKLGEGRVTREDLACIPEFYINPMSERILDVFCPKDLNFVEFVSNLAIFRPNEGDSDIGLNSKLAKLEFVFKMYDVDRDGLLTEDDLVRILHSLLGDQVTEERTRVLARRILGDAFASFQSNTGNLSSETTEIRLDFPAFVHAMRDVPDKQLSIIFLS